MAASGHVIASVQLIMAVLLSTSQVRADFLSGIKLKDPKQFDPAKFGPTQIESIDFRKAKFELPADLANPIETIKDKLVHHDPAQVAEDLSKDEGLKAKAEEALADPEHAAASILGKGKEAASKAKIEDLPEVLSDAAGAKVVEEVQTGMTEAKNIIKRLPSTRSAAAAEALRQTTSKMADTVNQTSLRFSEFLQSFGPKASAVLRHSGEALACKISDDCNPASVPPLQANPEDPQNWPFYAFMVLLGMVACGASCGVLGCMVSVGHKGKVLLSDALVPLVESSAREPTIQMSLPEAA